MVIINKNKTPILDRMNCKVSVLKGLEKNGFKFKFENMSFREMMDFIKLAYRSDDDENPEEEYGVKDNSNTKPKKEQQ